MQARFAAGFDLVLQVDLRRGVISDLHHGKARTHAACGEGRDASDKPLSELARDGVAVKGAGVHGEKKRRGERGKGAHSSIPVFAAGSGPAASRFLRWRGVFDCMMRSMVS